MKKFKVIDNLEFIDGVLMCKKPSGRSYQKAHYKQGDLDGACGAYSIAMILNILGVFEADELYSDTEYDKRFAEWKLISALNDQGLYRKGLTSNKIQDLLSKNYSKYVTVQCAHKDSHDLKDLIVHWIDNNKPVMVGLQFNKNDGHWVVAVGYMLDENGCINGILTLDPGTDSPTFSMWNGLLDLNKQPHKKYGYQYNSGNRAMVDMDEIIIITNN